MRPSLSLSVPSAHAGFGAGAASVLEATARPAATRLRRVATHAMRACQLTRWCGCAIVHIRLGSVVDRAPDRWVHARARSGREPHYRHAPPPPDASHRGDHRSSPPRNHHVTAQSHRGQRVGCRVGRPRISRPARRRKEESRRRRRHPLWRRSRPAHRPSAPESYEPPLPARAIPPRPSSHTICTGPPARADPLHSRH